jgi:fructose-specific phosphotransferase system IIC component
MVKGLPLMKNAMSVRRILFVVSYSFHELVVAKMGYLFPNEHGSTGSSSGGFLAILFVLAVVAFLFMSWAKLSAYLEKLHPILGFPLISMFVLAAILIGLLAMLG